MHANWIPLTREEQLNIIKDESFGKTVAVFKHSTRCNISSMALNRIKSAWDYTREELPLYYLDLLQYRNISNSIAEEYEVRHESPQLLVIRDGKCIYNASHSGIDMKELKRVLGQ